MKYPKTYTAIRQMIANALLETPLARGVVRKGAPRLTDAGEPVDPLLIDLMQEYAHVDTSGGNHSQYGSVHTYPSVAESAWPQNPSYEKTWDFQDVTDIRFLANITEAGPAGGSIFWTMYQYDGTDILPVTFTGGAPTVPVTVGFHDSGWKQPEWNAEAIDGRPAALLYQLSNPTGLSGTMGVGLCQVLLRKG